jgi:hypothetical protein
MGRVQGFKDSRIQGAKGNKVRHRGPRAEGIKVKRPAILFCLSSMPDALCLMPFSPTLTLTLL